MGESGCGKSSCGRSILRLVEPTSGEVVIDGTDIIALNAADLRRARRDMQMVFQDPFASLNPYRRLRDQVSEPLLNLAWPPDPSCRTAWRRCLTGSNCRAAFCAGFRTNCRAVSASASPSPAPLRANPKLIIADEAVSALDVSVQAQVLNLMMELAGRPWRVVSVHQPRHGSGRTGRAPMSA